MKKHILLAICSLTSTAAMAYPCNQVNGRAVIDITSDPGAISFWDVNDHLTNTYEVPVDKDVKTQDQLVTLFSKDGSSIQAKFTDLNYVTGPSIVVVGKVTYACDYN